MRKVRLLSSTLFIMCMSLTGCVLIKPTESTDSSSSQNIDNDDERIVEIYNLYLKNGGTLTYEEWLESIKGDKGEQGIQGSQGPKGDKGEEGKSAYDLYVEQYPGYIWGQEQWIKDLAFNQLQVVVSFETFGGEEVEPLVFCKGEQANIEQTTSRSHASFNGWYYDNKTTKEINYSFIATESFTAYAGYEFDSLSVTFIDRGQIIDIVNTNYYSLIEKPEDPINVGYQFLGWKEVGGSDYFDFSEPLSNGDIVLIACYDYDFLEVPAVIINTNDGSAITSKEVYTPSTVSILNTEEDWILDSVSAGVRGRGNTSWDMNKKPYRIKFDKKQSVLGSSYQAKSWTLIANHSDKTLSRNYLAYELAERFSGIAFSSCHHFVDLYLNDEYMGVYLLCDQLQSGTGRVEIDESIAEDGNNGYFIERDGRAPDEGIEGQDYFVFNELEYAIKTPDTESDNYLSHKETEIQYITDYLSQCWEAITSGAWSEVEELIDLDSFLDLYIIDELYANNDCGSASTYYYKDKNGKLFCGPAWDYDIGGGNINYRMGNTEDCPYDMCLLVRESNVWYQALLERDEFVNLLKQRIIDNNDTLLSVIDLLSVDNNESIYNQYKNAIERNFEKWHIMGRYVWPQPESVYTIDSVVGQFEYLETWLLGRYGYICEQYGVEFEEEIDAYLCTVNIDEGVEKILIYNTSDYSSEPTESLIGYSRDSSTGDYLKDGNGQLNFKIVLKDGFIIDSVLVEGTYKNLKVPSETLNENTYRITKITSDLEITVSSAAS